MEADARKKLLSDTVACLGYGWSYRKIGEINGQPILSDESRQERIVPSYDWIYICDNGGEFNVGRINMKDMRSVPYSDGPIMVDAGTMAYRLACAIRGDEIDYSFDCSFLVEDSQKHALEDARGRMSLRPNSQIKQQEERC